jgi:hypothetical protein
MDRSSQRVGIIGQVNAMLKYTPSLGFQQVGNSDSMRLRPM